MRSTNTLCAQQGYDLLIKNSILHDRSKHIKIRFHYIRECADRGLIKIDFIKTNEQLGDIFTKSLAQVKFEELRSNNKVDIPQFLGGEIVR